MRRSLMSAIVWSAVVVLAAALLRRLLDPVLGTTIPYATFYVSVVFMAWWGGLWPALLTLALSVPTAILMFLPRSHGLIVDGLDNVVGLFVFVGTAAAIAGFGGAMHGARHRAEAAAEDASEQRRRLQAELAVRAEKEAQLRSQRQWFRTTLSSIGDGVITTDAEGRVTFLNPVAESLTGWALAEAQGVELDRVFHIVNAHTREPAESPVRRVLREGRVAGLANHTALIGRDGTERAIDDSAAAILDEHGVVVGAVLIFRDVSDRRRAEIERSRLAAIVESSDDAIVGKTLDGTIATWNRGAERLYGYNAEEAIGQPVSMLVPPDQADDLARILDKVRRGEATEHVETVRRRKDGTLVDVSVTISPIRDAAGTLIGASAIARDITDRRRMQEALSESDRRKTRFLAVLAHELRNPLAPLTSALEILRLAGDDSAAATRAIGVMDRQLQQLGRLVDDLLDLSRITTGKVELRREHVPVEAIVESALETCRPLIEASHHTLTVTMPPGPVYIDGDPTRLGQALSNLLNNACKYTNPGGELSLDVAREGATAAIRVHDTGIGLSPDALTRIFDMFAQQDAASDRSRAGLGIGLALVKGFVELHGGTVTARSHGSGGGSEFIVRLPLAREQTPAAVPVAPSAETPVAKRRLLIVDDNRDSADTLALILGMMGHVTHTSYDGMAALAAAAAFCPEIVFLDIGMPGLDGYEVARRLRQRPNGRTLVLVAMTGWGQDDDRQRARDAGFDHHFTKPLDLAKLRAFLAAPEGGPVRVDTAEPTRLETAG